jgi:asparagine synthase (glutamine-hydrolysing)
MGIGTMAWAEDDSLVVVSNSPSEVARRPNSGSEIRHQAIFDYFFFHMIPGPATIFSGVNKLGPGCAVTFNRSGARVWRYWNPDFERRERASFGDLRSELHSVLRRAVEAEYGGPSTGAFLSGGLDSSTVSGLLAKVGTAPANTFSIGFGVESFNELEYARITNNHFGCVAHEYEVTPHDIVQAIPIVAAAFDEPFGNSSAIPTYACARYAKSLGMNRLLAGDGGDEIFAGNDRYARQKVFELFSRLPQQVRNPLKRFVTRFIDAESPLLPLRKLRSYVAQASIPLPERYESWNFAYREGANVMFCDDFIASVDTAMPLRHMKDVYDSTPSTDLLDRMLAYDWKFTLADNDLRKVTTMCNAAEIDVAYPFLDNDVVDLSIRVPSALKMNGLELRSFFKQAMKGFLPDEVLKKTKHGFGLPFGQWLKTDKPLADLVYGSLSDLKERAIVRSSFLDQLIEEHRGGHASYYGSVIWDLVILEEWFKHQSATAHTTERMSSQGA